MRWSIELDEGFLKEYKKLNLDQNQRDAIKKDFLRLQNDEKIGKLLTGYLFPCWELKYRSWGIRIIYMYEEDKLIIVLAAGRKKDDETKVYKKAFERKNDRAK